jgi:hypothetical protein
VTIPMEERNFRCATQGSARHSLNETMEARHTTP